MTYRRRQTRDASLADWRSQTERLAAVRSIRLVRQSKAHDPKISGQIGPCFTRRPDLRRSDPTSAACLSLVQFFKCGSKSVWCEIIFHSPFSLRKTFVARMWTVSDFPSGPLFSPFS
jgi:hypothetical protein